MEPMVGGPDGCPAGWVMVSGPVDGGGLSEVEVFADLTDVITRLNCPNRPRPPGTARPVVGPMSMTR